MLRFAGGSLKSILGFCLSLAVTVPLGSAQAQKYKELYSFAGGSDGAYPTTGVIADGSGNLYGITPFGGSNNCKSGCGTVFKLAPDGTKSILYDFLGGNDGYYPTGPLLMDARGNLYGTTLEGGGSACDGYGCGTIFKVAAVGNETVLYAFQGGNDGSLPRAGVISDSDGNFYGTTEEGGGSGTCNGGCGTVFEFAADGSETVLHAFAGGRDGALPFANVIETIDGSLYGTTFAGGGSDMCSGGCGTVFKVSADGHEKVLYPFGGEADGAFPEAALVMDKAHNLYSTTVGGGGRSFSGTVFELAPDGTEAVLYPFTGGTDGGQPFGGLLADKTGDFYGTTSEGGDKNDGTIFELAANGTETVLHSFSGHAGARPQCDLLKVGNTLYGTTPGLRKKTSGYGDIFALKVKSAGTANAN